MGKASRMKRARRAARLKEQSGPPMRRGAFNILLSLHKVIQNHCHENSRRCWECMGELIAQATGWPTESEEAKHVAEKMSTDAWMRIVDVQQH